MNLFSEGNRNKMTSSFDRKYDPIFNELFDTFLNIPSCQEVPNIQNDWIDRFLVLFKKELAANFGKSKDYLKKLNQYPK